MPKLGKKKTDEAPAASQAGAPAADQAPAAGQVPGQGPAPEPPKTQEPPPMQELPKESHVVVTLLTILLVLVGLAEVFLLGYIGIQTFRSNQARKAYAAQQTTVDDEGNEIERGAFYIGPMIHIEDGEVVWRRPDSLYASGWGASADLSGAAGAEDETRLANMSVVQRPYRLAQEDGGQEA